MNIRETTFEFLRNRAMRAYVRMTTYRNVLRESAVRACRRMGYAVESTGELCDDVCRVGYTYTSLWNMEHPQHLDII